MLKPENKLGEHWFWLALGIIFKCLFVMLLQKRPVNSYRPLLIVFKPSSA